MSKGFGIPLPCCAPIWPDPFCAKRTGRQKILPAGFYRLQVQLRFAEKGGLSGQGHAAAAHRAVQRAAPARRLTGDKAGAAQPPGPIRGNVAVARTADRVFRHVELGRKAARHAVKPARQAGGRRRLQKQAVQAAQFFHVRLQAAHSLFAVEHTQTPRPA